MGIVRKVFRITPRNYYYAEYYHLIIVALNETEALELVTKSKMFREWQFPLSIKEVDLTKSDIIGMERMDI